MLPLSDLLQLKRFNTPTLFNGWEQITRHQSAREGFNLEPLQDFMPPLGTLAGYAVTLVIEPGNPAHKADKARKVADYRAYVAAAPGPKIVVVQDLDKPRLYGSFWGEVNASVHRALGCLGTLTDGGVRDLDEMTALDFKALARSACVGHAHSTPIRWGCPVEVFGCLIQPGQLILADKHGFLAIPPEDESALLDATRFMDANECQTVLPAAQDTAGLTPPEILSRLESSRAAFSAATKARFTRPGEW